MILKDTIKLIETTEPNGYGDVTVSATNDLKCLFIQSTGQSNSPHGLSIDSDAHAYIDKDNAIVKDKAYRLEGMYIIANLFNGTETESWYKIIKVRIGQKKLLCNDIENVHIYLKKTEAL